MSAAESFPKNVQSPTDWAPVIHVDPPQELAYYLKSLELLGGLARGRGSHSLITKPFVAGGGWSTLVHQNGQGLRTET